MPLVSDLGEIKEKDAEGTGLSSTTGSAWNQGMNRNKETELQVR